jgi:hypothetical protein
LQTFNYKSGVHDVWLLPSAECNFDAPGAKLVGPPATGNYVATLDKPGTYYYACSVVGHCDAGQFLEVNVAAAGAPAAASARPTFPPKLDDSVPAGKCSEPAIINAATNEYLVSCRSPAVSLAPGDNIYPDILLPNPYPKPSVSQEVILETVAAEIVDENGTSVPLSEVYLHHIFGDIRFVPGEGAEVRRSPMRSALPAPYFLAVNTTEVADDSARFANFHVIRTTGVAPDAVKACIECWCEDTEPQTGSIGCCSKCPTTSSEGAKDYYLDFNVTYRLPSNPVGKIEDTADMKRAVALVLDIHGGVEYSVAPVPTSVEGSLNMPTSTYNRTYPFDFFCPQNQSFSIVKCWGHQHIGAKCINMTDTSTGQLICSSCPTYGNTPDLAGDEKGYLVGMSATVLDPPYELQPGQEVTLTSTYDADQPYAGVMSLAALVLTAFDARDECNIDYAGFVQPPSNLGGNSTDGSGSGLSLEEVIQQTETLIAQMPDTCTSFKQYMTGTVSPCLPAAVETVNNKGMAMTSMGPGGGMKSMATCCAAIQSTVGGFGEIAGALYSGNVETDCLCSLGEIFLFGYRQQILSAIADFSDTCTGRESDGGASNTVKNGLALLLNSVFAPKCPNIAAQLNDNGSITEGAAMDMPAMGGDMAATDSSNAQSPSSSSSSSSSLVGAAALKKFIIFTVVVAAFF